MASRMLAIGVTLGLLLSGAAISPVSAATLTVPVDSMATLTPAQIATNTAKQKALTSLETLMHTNAPANAVKQALSRFRSQWGPGYPAVRTTGSAALEQQPSTVAQAASAPQSWHLYNITTVAQQTSYWCGPASVYMILAGLGEGNGPSGQTLSQQNLANLMGTTTSGTDFGEIPYGLNSWQEATGNTLYNVYTDQSSSAGTLTSFLDDVSFDVGEEYVATVDDVQLYGSVLLPGYYPQYDAWH